MNENYKIEKGIPAPTPRKMTGLCAVVVNMKIGESIVITPREKMNAYNAGKRNGYKMATQVQPDGNVRVWRIA